MRCQCPQGHVINAKDELVGKKAHCPGCQTVFTLVPMVEKAAPAPSVKDSAALKPPPGPPKATAQAPKAAPERAPTKAEDMIVAYEDVEYDIDDEAEDEDDDRRLDRKSREKKQRREREQQLTKLDMGLHFWKWRFIAFTVLSIVSALGDLTMLVAAFLPPPDSLPGFQPGIRINTPMSVVYTVMWVTLILFVVSHVLSMIGSFLVVQAPYQAKVFRTGMAMLICDGAIAMLPFPLYFLFGRYYFYYRIVVAPVFVASLVSMYLLLRNLARYVKAKSEISKVTVTLAFSIFVYFLYPIIIAVVAMNLGSLDIGVAAQVTIEYAVPMVWGVLSTALCVYTARLIGTLRDHVPEP